MKIILIHKRSWESAEWNLGFSALRTPAPAAFGSEEAVFTETYDFSPEGDRREVIFVHANDTDRWAPMNDNLSVGEIERFYEDHLLALFPFTTLEGNSRKRDDPVYGARAIGRLMRAIADGHELHDAADVRRCLDELEIPPSVDAVQALAILCQGYILATIAADPAYAESDEVQGALERIGLKNLDEGAALLKIAAEKVVEVRRRSWWTTVFPSRPDLGEIEERPDVRRLLDTVWAEGRSEAPSLDPPSVARAYLALVRS